MYRELYAHKINKMNYTVLARELS
uniref:Uncharacterized protein n=1 Tax=Arundo donax TaxID=35708 RepID=A0A0A9AHB9_ARUDO